MAFSCFRFTFSFYLVEFMICFIVVFNQFARSRALLVIQLLVFSLLLGSKSFGFFSAICDYEWILVLEFTSVRIRLFHFLFFQFGITSLEFVSFTSLKSYFIDFKLLFCNRTILSAHSHPTKCSFFRAFVSHSISAPSFVGGDPDVENSPFLAGAHTQ